MTKRCKCCSKELVRRDNEKLYNWNKRIYCDLFCSGKGVHKKLEITDAAPSVKKAKPCDGGNMDCPMQKFNLRKEKGNKLNAKTTSKNPANRSC